MSRLLYRSSLRFYLRHPWQLGLTLLSIALGSAVMIAVDLANNSARVSFDRSVQALAGPMSHELLAVEGALDERLYRQLRVDWGYRQSLPVLERRVRLRVPAQTEGGSAPAAPAEQPAAAGRSAQFTLTGIDPFALLGLPAAQGSGPAQTLSPDTLPRLLSEAGTVVLPAAVASSLGVAAGAQLLLERGPDGAGAERSAARLEVIAVLPEGAGSWFAERVITDIASAQQLLDARGQLSRIQLRLGAAEAEALRAQLPPGVELRAYAAQRAGFEQMTAAFRTNLQAMSLLAMLVGAFLVYNTMTFAALQREPGFAVMRMCGASGAQLHRLLLGEALALWLAGGALGVLLGVVLGQGLLVLVSRTIADLFVNIRATELDLAPAQLARSLGVTLLAILVATVLPARRVARTAPATSVRRSQQERSGARQLLPLAGLGGVLMLGCPLLILLAERSLIAGFAGLFLFVLGYSLCIPLLMSALLSWLVSLLARSARAGGSRLRLAVRGVQGALSRTALATVALAIAVSATVGVGIMTGAFRASVADWLDTTLQSDIFVSATPGESDSERSLDPAWLARIHSLPGVVDTSTGIDHRLRINGQRIRTLVLEPARHSNRGFEFLDGDPARIEARFLRGEVVLASEPLAWHQQLARGDHLEVLTPGGPVQLEIGGIYRDYSATEGMVVMPRALYARYWDDTRIGTVGIALAEDADAAAITAQLERWAEAEGAGVGVRSSRAIQELSLAIFDRTFVITDVLRLLVVLVAFIGVFSALMALLLEKGQEYAVLRATGLTPGQLQRLVLGQSALVGVCAGLLAIPLGWVLSVILIDVINRRSFGWTMAQQFPAGIPLEALALAVGAAVLAALYPARRIAAVPLRERLAGL